MTKKYLFEELRGCMRVALACETYPSANLAIHEARGMINIAYMYDIINNRQYHTLCELSRDFDLYLFHNKPL